VEDQIVGVHVRMWRGHEPVIHLPDPAGGWFDAAGDFDRLIPADDASFPVLGRADPYGDVELASEEMPELIAEIDRVLSGARPGPESNGLARLRVLAALCAETADSSLLFARG
jgi:hypothetical protein